MSANAVASNLTPSNSNTTHIPSQDGCDLIAIVTVCLEEVEPKHVLRMNVGGAKAHRRGSLETILDSYFVINSLRDDDTLWPIGVTKSTFPPM